jgi:hypothetical protein
MDNNEISQNSPGMLHPYKIRLRDEINQISPSAYNRRALITKLELSIGLKILGILIGYACQGQNILPITLARKQIGMIPTDWLTKYVPQVSKAIICFDDELEYRRLLELVDETVPKLLRWATEQGKNSPNEEVREASEDFAIKISDK